MTKLKDREELKNLWVKQGYRLDFDFLWSWIKDYKDKALQSYSREMDKVIGKDVKLFDGSEEDTNLISEHIKIRNNLRQSQRQEKLKVDKKWGIK